MTTSLYPERVGVEWVVARNLWAFASLHTVVRHARAVRLIDCDRLNINCHTSFNRPPGLWLPVSLVVARGSRNVEELTA